MFAASVARASVPRLAAAAARPAVRSSRTAAASVLQHQTARTYATEAKAADSKAVDSKPPIPLFGVDGTYASALFTAAAKTSTLDSTATAMSRLHSTFTKDPKLQTIMQAPTLSAEDKDAVIKELLKASQISESSKEGATVRNFLHTLADNNRLGLLDSTCVKFDQLMSASRGEVELTVTSAEELDRKVLQRLEAAVSKSRFVGQGHKLKVVSKVQPDIRGGLIVEIGDRTIDLSVSGKMARMNKLLKDTL